MNRATALIATGLFLAPPPAPTDRLIVLGAYGLCLWPAFHAFVVLHEEPTLRRVYGAGYAAFERAVPRWLPRIRPYR